MENVLITGGTGLIGSHLSKLLLNKGYSVSLLSRSKKNMDSGIRYYYWDIARGELEDNALKTADHIIHLAGASIAGGRWTKKRKEELYSSRIGNSALILQKLKRIGHHVKTFISASAVGYYGDGRDKLLTEDAPCGKDFLACLCRDWESQAMQMKSRGIRAVALRTGIVLSRQGGVLPELARPMHFGVAVYMGDGKQYLSWIHIDDVCRAYLFALKNKNLEGVYNAVAPQPVTNREMITFIREARQSHALILPAPAFALKLALGEMSHALLTGQRCSSEKLIKAGFEFRYPDLKGALQEIYKG
ncbi:MAG TPA: TIGR01777 family oxidoreductase [Chitinophagales bacterium]|nr:TIGR01777 family oxidoreductase [Chitinophagales bacterium]